MATLLCSGTTANRERAGRVDRTRHSPKGERSRVGGRRQPAVEHTPSKEVKVGGFVSMQKEAFVTGPKPQDRQLVQVITTQPYDRELGAELGITRGVQWWYPGKTLYNARSSIERKQR